MFKGKICISRIDKIGDMILTLPVIKSVKIQNPSLEIHILASAYNAKVLKHVKYVDKVLLIGSNTRSFIKEIRQLRKIKYDFFINFSPNIKSFILCFFSKSQKKATLILLSRYRNNFFSKALLRIFTKIFCHFQYVVNRFERLCKNQELHQTKMMFNLIEECNIKYSQDVSIDIDLPLKKLIFYQEKTIVIHLSDKWINSFYSENNFLEFQTNPSFQYTLSFHLICCWKLVQCHHHQLSNHRCRCRIHMPHPNLPWLEQAHCCVKYF